MSGDSEGMREAAWEALEPEPPIEAQDARLSRLSVGYAGAKPT